MNKLVDAINLRVSRRNYVNHPVDKERIQKLNQLVQHYNHKANLRIELLEDGGVAFSSFTKTYGLLKNVRTLLVMKGLEEDPFHREKLGYYGELVVLEATLLGLGSCWVGGSFDKSSDVFSIQKGEKLHYVIALGDCPEDQSFREKMIHGLTHRRKTRVEDLILDYENGNDYPIDFMEAMKAVHKAPSAVNAQPVRFEYKNGEIFAHHMNPKIIDSVDLGIAKAHFTVVLGGRFEWGNGGRWIKE